jgi:AraC-like DNA-binding protein
MLADKTGLSKNYMCSLFRSEMNMTINSYIQKEKIRAASDLLAYTDYALQDISEYLAFSSLSYFIRIFKAQTGTTPGTYRKKHYGKHFSKNASAR